jgi:hypothetical protein
MTKCDGCKNLGLIGGSLYCYKLKHKLEHGYAMECHARECGE